MIDAFQMSFQIQLFGQTVFQSPQFAPVWNKLLKLTENRLVPIFEFEILRKIQLSRHSFAIQPFSGFPLIVLLDQNAFHFIFQGDREVIRILGAAYQLNEPDVGKRNSSWACKYISDRTGWLASKYLD